MFHSWYSYMVQLSVAVPWFGPTSRLIALLNLLFGCGKVIRCRWLFIQNLAAQIMNSWADSIVVQTCFNGILQSNCYLLLLYWNQWPARQEHLLCASQRSQKIILISFVIKISKTKKPRNHIHKCLSLSILVCSVAHSYLIVSFLNRKS